MEAVVAFNRRRDAINSRAAAIEKKRETLLAELKQDAEPVDVPKVIKTAGHIRADYLALLGEILSAYNEKRNVHGQIMAEYTARIESLKAKAETRQRTVESALSSAGLSAVRVDPSNDPEWMAHMRVAGHMGRYPPEGCNASDKGLRAKVIDAIRLLCAENMKLPASVQDLFTAGQ
jgi:hypothetical protein